MEEGARCMPPRRRATTRCRGSRRTACIYYVGAGILLASVVLLLRSESSEPRRVARTSLHAGAKTHVVGQTLHTRAKTHVVHLTSALETNKLARFAPSALRRQRRGDDARALLPSLAVVYTAAAAQATWRMSDEEYERAGRMTEDEVRGDAESTRWAWPGARSDAKASLPLGLHASRHTAFHNALSNHTFSRLRLCGVPIDARIRFFHTAARRAFPNVNSRVLRGVTPGDRSAVRSLCRTALEWDVNPPRRATAAALERRDRIKRQRARVTRLLERFKRSPTSLYHGDGDEPSLEQLRKLDTLALAQWAELVLLSPLERLLVWFGRPLPVPAEELAVKASAAELLGALSGTPPAGLRNLNRNSLEVLALRTAQSLAPFEHARLALDGAGNASTADIEDALEGGRRAADGRYGERLVLRASSELAALVSPLNALELRRLAPPLLRAVVEHTHALFFEARGALEAYAAYGRRQRCAASRSHVSLGAQGSELSLALRSLHGREVLALTSSMLEGGLGVTHAAWAAAPLPQLHALLDEAAAALARAESWVVWSALHRTGGSGSVLSSGASAAKAEATARSAGVGLAAGGAVEAAELCGRLSVTGECCTTNITLHFMRNLLTI